MPLKSVFPPSIPLRYQLLHDTFTCLTQSADLACTALLLYYYYTRELYGYFNATVTLVSLASLLLTLHFSHLLTRSNSLLLLLLYTPAAFTAPFLVLLAAYRLPPHLPRSLLPSLLPPSFAMSAPAGAADSVKQYQLHTLYRHSAFHFSSLVWTAPVSLVTLVYVASHQHDTSWLPITALLVHVTVITSRLWMFSFSIHTPTLAFLLLLIAADVLNLYASVLLLSASTATQPLYHVWFYSSYSHPTLFNALLLNKTFTLFLLFSFTFLCLLTFELVRKLTLRQPPTAWWVLLLVVQYTLMALSFVLLFVPVVLLLFAMKCVWVVIVVYCVVLYEQWSMPVFYRRLYGFLTASSTFTSSTAHSTPADRVYAANQYFAQRCLTLYPPPACTTPTKRQWVEIALHVLSLKPSEFDVADLMRRADAGVWVSCRRTMAAVQLVLTVQPTDVWYQRFGRLVCSLMFYVCLPCYLASVLWDVVWPIIGALYLAAHGGCADGGGLLAVIVGCMYGAVLLTALLLLPSVLHFHSVISSVLRYDLPRLQHNIERRQPDKSDQPALPCYPQQCDSEVAVSRREDDWRLLAFNVDGDTLSDWPYQMSSLLYSRMLRKEVRSALVSGGGMVEAVSDMVVSYLPAMEREREGQEAEDGEWMERRRQQWLAVREPQSILPPTMELWDDEAADEKEDTVAHIELVIRNAPDDDEAAEAAADDTAIIPSPSAPPAVRPTAVLSLGAYDRWRLGLRGPVAVQQQWVVEVVVDEGDGGTRFERMREESDNGRVDERDEKVERTEERRVGDGLSGMSEPLALSVVHDDESFGLSSGRGGGGGSGRGRGSRVGGSFDETKMSRSDDDKHYRLLDLNEQEYR